VLHLVTFTVEMVSLGAKLPGFGFQLGDPLLEVGDPVIDDFCEGYPVRLVSATVPDSLEPCGCDNSTGCENTCDESGRVKGHTGFPSIR
jgi:hypothetical protein